jgi:hypothetical protein
MSKKDVINAIEVKEACSESWDEMQGNDQVRFCSHCAKDVNNISEMTRKEALRLVRRSEGNLCIRYIKDPKTSRPLFSEKIYKKTRRAGRLAAGVMTASISLSSAAYAQGSMRRAPEPANTEQASGRDTEKRERSADHLAAGRVSGTLRDRTEAVVAGADVTIIDENSAVKLQTRTNQDGVYLFENVPHGKYKLEFTSSGFMKTVITGIEISDSEFLYEQNAYLDVGAAGGAFVVVEEPLKHKLSVAVEDDDLETVRSLIIRHADVNAREKRRGGITPLFLAVENGNLAISEIFLRFGARVNVRNSNRQTPLMMLDDDATAELVNLLVKYRARTDLVDNQGNTALILATDADPDVSVINALLDAGADPDHQNEEGETALMKAANNDNLEAVRALLKAGADVNMKNNDGETAWDIATDPEVTRLIESFGGKPGDPDDTENAPTPDGN